MLLKSLHSPFCDPSLEMEVETVLVHNILLLMLHGCTCIHYNVYFLCFSLHSRFVAFSSESEAIKSQELQGKLKVGPYTPKVNYGNPKDKLVLITIFPTLLPLQHLLNPQYHGKHLNQQCLIAEHDCCILNDQSKHSHTLHLIDRFSSFKPRRDGPMPAMRSPMDDFASNNRQDFGELQKLPVWSSKLLDRSRHYFIICYPHQSSSFCSRDFQ